MTLPKFKIRCSAIHHIMGGSQNKPTAKQMAKLNELLNREKPLTFNMQMERDELIAKRDAKPALSDGAKTYCELWLKSKLYGEEYEFTSKYTDKGTECEPEGMEMVCDRMGYGMLTKNDEQFENEYCTGTPDALTAKVVEEIKCPYTSKTFPLFDTTLPQPDYYWQCQGYMWLTNKPAAAVNYCLIDAPAHIIEMETGRKARSLGMIDPPQTLFDWMEQQMTYSHLPVEFRHKRFTIERNDTDIALIETYVKMCRDHIAELLATINPTYVPIHQASQFDHLNK